MAADLKYEISLFSVFWDINSKDTRFFETIEEQNAYFDNLGEGKKTPLLNFKMGDNISTTIIFRDKSGRTPEELVRSNYAMVKKIENEVVIERRYFFAEVVSQDSSIQMIVNLELDDIQTNYFKYKEDIAPCTINRAHLNRWVEADSESVRFDTDTFSPLFINEFEDLPKYLKERKEVSLHTSNIPEVENWLNENVENWCYVFMSNNNLQGLPQEFVPLNTKYEINEEISENNYEGSYVIFCVPIYKSYKRLTWDRYSFCDFDISGFTQFIKLNSANILDLKFSNIPPCDFNIYGTEEDIGYNIDEIGNLTISVNPRDANFIAVDIGGEVEEVILYVNKVKVKPIEKNIDTGIGYRFRKSDIILSGLDQKYEPKLIMQNAKEICLTQNGEKFIFDPLKLRTNSLIVSFNEVLQPGITRNLTTIKNGYYANLKESYMGLNSSFDNSIIYENEPLKTFLAQNKNYYLQRGVGIANNIFMSSAFGGDIFKSIFSAIPQAIETNLTIDNLRNAPSTINNSNGDVILNMLINKLNINIEIWEAFETDKLFVWGNMIKNGYKFGRVGKLSEYDNIRKRFNYIEAEIDEISAPISNREKQRLRNVFSRGVRFWNSDNLEYVKENYERSLENA